MYFCHKIFSIYYEKYGDGNQNIIILPGWGDNRQSFNYLINCLKDDFTIYIFDYPGFGKTRKIEHVLTIYDYAIVIKDFIADKRISNSIILGHSFGGRLIILLASLYKIKFKKIVLIDSAGIKEFSLILYFKTLLYKLLKKLKFLFKNKNKYINTLIRLFASDDYIKIDPIMQKTFINIVNTDLTKFLSLIKNETLILWGTNDLVTKLEDGIKMNKLIPNSFLIPIDKAGHFPYLDYPYYCYSIIYEYLKEDIIKKTLH